MPLRDLTGKRFGKLKVLEEARERDAFGRAQWKCLCACGKTVVVRSNNLCTGNTRACGCVKAVSGARRMFKNLKCFRFGCLTVIKRSPSTDGKAHWECLCSCGNKTVVWGAHLRNGHTKSCGCLVSKAAKVNIRKLRRRIVFKGKTHPRWDPTLTTEDRLGMRKYPRYSSWRLRVFSRDGWCCSLCGSESSIEAHHLDGYEWAKNKRTITKNGITLCYECHKRFHDDCGRRRNTVEQFGQWAVLFVQTRFNEK